MIVLEYSKFCIIFCVGKNGWGNIQSSLCIFSSIVQYHSFVQRDVVDVDDDIIFCSMVPYKKFVIKTSIVSLTTVLTRKIPCNIRLH